MSMRRSWRTYVGLDNYTELQDLKIHKVYTKIMKYSTAITLTLATMATADWALYCGDICMHID
ncbi:hypothetical protein N7486_010134 [Penicillium sp. IBT 16267x]|nr:hypothetical protein N7486_010134 [Penicillium sp. IBT 16267x]